MFRKNYLPKMTIYKCSKTDKYFAEELGSVLSDSLCQCPETGDFVLSWVLKPHKVESLDECLEALYWVAYKRHKREIHKGLTYSKGIKV